MSAEEPALESLFGPRAMPLGRIEHDCAYLPGHKATDEVFLCWTLSPARYLQLMDLGFRRSGSIVYRPRCAACSACQPMRVNVAAFKPSKSQRRVLRRNADVKMELGEPEFTPEKIDLYQRYLALQHPDSPQESTPRESLRNSCTQAAPPRLKPAIAMLRASSGRYRCCDITRDPFKRVSLL